jgi:hypothetical protein
MRLSDEAFEDMLKCFDSKDIPADRAVARQALENFLDLLKIIMRPLPLPPPGAFSFRDSTSDTDLALPRRRLTKQNRTLRQ